MIYFYAPAEQLQYFNDYLPRGIVHYRDINSLKLGGLTEEDMIIVTYIKDKLEGLNLYELMNKVYQQVDIRPLVFYNVRLTDHKHRVVFDGFQLKNSYPLNLQPKSHMTVYNSYANHIPPSFLFFVVVFNKKLMKYLKKYKKYGIIKGINSYLAKNPNEKLYDSYITYTIDNFNVNSLCDKSIIERDKKLLKVFKPEYFKEEVKEEGKE